DAFGDMSADFSQAGRSIANQPDGKVLVAGEVDLGNGGDVADYESIADLYVERLDAGTAGPATAPTAMATPVPRPDAQLNSNGTLLVTTAGGNDSITVDITAGNVRLDRNGTITTYPQASVKKLDIQSGDG